MAKKIARRAALWTAIAVPFVVGFEGMRTVAYRDPIGIPTACAGETKGIKLGMKFSIEECNTMLEGRLVEFYESAERIIPTLGDMPPARIAAVVSLNYNIGPGNLAKSSVARLLNAGHVRAACDAFLKWDKAGGIVWRGLTRRRVAERELCLRDA